MSFAYPGLTHCEKCGNPLKDDECFICQRCEEKEQEVKRQYQQIDINILEKLLTRIRNSQSYTHEITDIEGQAIYNLVKQLKAYNTSKYEI